MTILEALKELYEANGGEDFTAETIAEAIAQLAEVIHA